MFVVAYQNTMRSAKPKPPKEKPEVRNLVEINRQRREAYERRARREAWERAIQAERTKREAKRRKLLERIENVRKALAADVVTVPRRVPVNDLLATFCFENKVTIEQLRAHNRQVALTILRDKAIRLVRDARPDMSLPAIGRVFDRDHTTIIWSLKKTSRPEDKR